MPDSDPAPVDDLLDDVLDEARAHWPSAMLTQGHLFARVRPPGDLAANERYAVDLERAQLLHTLDEAPCTWARAQLVATYTPATQDWLFGFANASVPTIASTDIDAAVEGDRALRALPGTLGAIAAADARLLAQWIALRAGYFAVYPAQLGATVAFLAVRLRLGQDEPQTDERDLWCSGCGRSKFQVARLVRGEGGAICLTCVEQAAAIRDAMPAGALVELDRDGVTPFMPPCIITGRHSKRLFLPYAALAYECIDPLLKLLR